MKTTTLAIAISAFALSACIYEKPQKKMSQEVSGDVAKVMKETVAEAPVKKLDAPYVVTSDMYPSPPKPHYGPKPGSIKFVDTDPGETIGGTIYMRPADVPTGITQYMIHWGLEVGAPGTADDAGAGDLGGDCRGFRDTGHVVMKMAEDAGDLMKWDIPQGTVVPKDAVYFVGHALYGDIHNLAKCTQTPIDNMMK